MRTQTAGKKIYRDGLEEIFIGVIKVHTTQEGHIIESYRLSNGKRRFFATLAGTHWCAHGNTIAQAVADALWKDPANRPSREAIVDEIKKAGKKRKITLNEFREITGACLEGCRAALATSGVKEEPMTAFDVRDKVSKEWGNQLISALGWEKK